MRNLQNGLGAAFAGAAAVIIVLGVLLPFYLLFKIDYAPTLASNAIIEYTPPDNAIALQNLLGPFSFPFALMGGIMLIGMMGLLVGLAYGLVRRLSILLAVIGASVLMIGIVWLAYPAHMTAPALMPFLATGPLLWAITRRDPQVSAAGQGISRREVLKRAAVFSFGGLLLSAIDGFPVFTAALNAARAGRKLFDYTPPAARVEAFQLSNPTPEVTPVEDFYVMRKFPTVVPPVLPDWKLTISGLVQKPLALTFEEIQAFPRSDVYLTRQCVSNPVGGNLISTAFFSGARLADVIKGTNVKPEAVQLVFYGRDGYSEGVPLDYALEHGLLPYAMNGVFLPEAYGAPLKAEVPGLYGFKNMKWLERIEAVDQPYRSVWAREGWTETAIVKTMSRIDAVKVTEHGATLLGIAFAGIRGISRVEVQINGGDWQAATLHTPPLSGQTWVQWRFDIEQRGTLNIAVRAVDGTGALQIEAKQPQFPDGASGYHSMTVTV